MTPTYRIETENLVLRCVEPRDAQARLDTLGRSYARLADIMGWKEPPTLADVKQFIRKCRGEFDLDQNRMFGVFDRAESAFFGEVMLLTRAGHGAREIGVWMAPERWGKGTATEAVGALVHTAFIYEPWLRLDYVCAVSNERSAKLAERVGFVREGLLRGRTTPRDPTPVDSYVFSMLRPELSTSRAAAMPVRALDCFGEPLDRYVGESASPE